MTQLRTAKRFTVDEYYAMSRAGILAEDERVELIEGEVVPMPPIGSMHGGTVDRLTEVFGEAARASGLLLRVQGPIRLDDFSEPVPDLAVLRARDDYYRHAHPHASDVLLLIEVSDATVRYDRDVKVPLYARAGIGEVWIVDIDAGVIDAFRLPEAGAYGEHTSYRLGDSVTAEALPGLEVAVDGVFG
jgi:Uma2 family endonuclease